MGLSEVCKEKDDWWDEGGSFFLLHRINPVRFGYFSAIAGQNLGGLCRKKVLDVGCGGGLLSEKFAGCGAVVTGIDLSAPAIEAARRHAQISGFDIDYRVSSVEGLSASNPERFDCVVCSEVLEHVEVLSDFLRDVCPLLKEGGLFFFSTINRTLKARVLTVFVAEDILNIIPKGTHDFRRFIMPSQLVRLLEEQSVFVEDIRGLSVDFARLEFRLTRDTSVNYLGWGVKR